MKYNYRTIKNLFLRQSYIDSWEDYQRSLRKSSYITWDYVVLTASNEEQAEGYRQQIDYRLKRKLLPDRTSYVVLSDPDGKRVGSGGATFYVMSRIAEMELQQHDTKNIADPDSINDRGSVDENQGCLKGRKNAARQEKNPFKGKRILVIHSGGDSKRVPQYSACGKLFAPVMRELPNGQSSTLFDEFIIGMSGVPARMQEGMLVVSGDVLLLFNPLQIDLQVNGAAAISMKEAVETGKDHGVFLSDAKGNVELFLHKQPEERLRKLGAVDGRGNVDLDTGAILMDGRMLEALYSLISTDGVPDREKLKRFVNEKARVSFYGDFLYPLANRATLEGYCMEAAEGSICEELLWCRKQLWKALRGFTLKLIRLSPAEFIHFGTTKELAVLVTEGIDNYVFLDWKRNVMTNREVDGRYAVHTSFVAPGTEIGSGSYIENSILGKKIRIGKRSIVSGVDLEEAFVPDNVVIHGLELQDGRYAARIYGVEDNPKKQLGEGVPFLGTELEKFLEAYSLEEEVLWPEKASEDESSLEAKSGEERSLWTARLYPVCGSMEEAVQAALDVYSLVAGMDGKEMGEQSGSEEIRMLEKIERKNPERENPGNGQIRREDLQELLMRWLASERTSLYESFDHADIHAAARRREQLEDRILTARFLNAVQERKPLDEALQIYGENGISERNYRSLMEAAETADLGGRMRIYYYLSRYMKGKKKTFCGKSYDVLESRCFSVMQEEIVENAIKHIPDREGCRIAREEVSVRLPVRVNWGGGWTDTPPYCIEKGGVVLNASIKLRGRSPVHVEVKRLKEYEVRFESADIGVSGRAETIEEIQECDNPYDAFALHKAALIACGIIPQEGRADLKELLEGYGGGIQISTQVEGVPKGSGLGTSSILAAACVKALFKFFGKPVSDSALCDIVLSMEQLMSTGGGWQDQIGGLVGGIKMITTRPGIDQKLKIEKVEVPEEAMKELSERFVLIYTGQRRLARNLLRDVVGSYIGGRKESVRALEEMKETAALMEFALKQGDIEGFAGQMDRHWELSKQLDGGSTNTCIDQIFLACEDLLVARFISGAGGGGFLQGILKRGVSREMLSRRLRDVFGDTGVDVWDCEFV